MSIYMIFFVMVYLTILVAIKAMRIGVGHELYYSWPMLPGVLFGTQFIWLDRWVSRYLRVQEFLDQDRLLTQNIVFAYGWILVAFFGMTSTAGVFGKGFVMGIGLQLVVRAVDSLAKFAPPPDFFWPIKRQLSESEKKWAIGMFLAVFGLLTFLV